MKSEEEEGRLENLRVAVKIQTLEYLFHSLFIPLSLAISISLVIIYLCSTQYWPLPSDHGL